MTQGTDQKEIIANINQRKDIGLTVVDLDHQEEVGINRYGSSKDNAFPSDIVIFNFCNADGELINSHMIYKLSWMTRGMPYASKNSDRLLEVVFPIGAGFLKDNIGNNKFKDWGSFYEWYANH